MLPCFKILAEPKTGFKCFSIQVVRILTWEKEWKNRSVILNYQITHRQKNKTEHFSSVECTFNCNVNYEAFRLTVVESENKQSIGFRVISLISPLCTPTTFPVVVCNSGMPHYFLPLKSTPNISVNQQSYHNAACKLYWPCEYIDNSSPQKTHPKQGERRKAHLTIQAT